MAVCVEEEDDEPPRTTTRKKGPSGKGGEGRPRGKKAFARRTEEDDRHPSKPMYLLGRKGGQEPEKNTEGAQIKSRQKKKKLTKKTKKKKKKKKKKTARTGGENELLEYRSTFKKNCASCSLWDCRHTRKREREGVKKNQGGGACEKLPV